jgi:rhodanese-related sulfurtransferase
MLNVFLIILIANLLFKKKTIKLISSNEAKNKINQKYFNKIIDVRTKKEYELGNHPKAINLPIEPINNLTNINLKNIDRNKPLLIYCRSGRRALNAAKILKNEFKFKKIYYVNSTYKTII